MIKNILFDLDNTIFDFDRAERTALEQTFLLLGIEPTGEKMKRYSEINDKHWKMLEQGEITRAQVLTGRFQMLFQELGENCSPDTAWKTYETLLRQQHFFIEGALELLEQLHQKYDLYIVSNGTASVQEQRIADAKIAPYFKKIFISQTIGVNKPAKEFFERCFMEIPDFNREETIVIGDSLTSDIQGGNNAGIFTCWYNPKKQPLVQNIKVDFQIENLSQVILVLEQIV